MAVRERISALRLPVNAASLPPQEDGCVRRVSVLKEVYFLVK